MRVLITGASGFIGQSLIKYLLGINCEIFNLGIGEGVTVIEAIKAFEKVSGKKLNYKIAPRREGDVVAIYANNDKAMNLLGWSPTRGIEEIMKTAWQWEVDRKPISSEA